MQVIRPDLATWVFEQGSEAARAIRLTPTLVVRSTTSRPSAVRSPAPTEPD